MKISNLTSAYGVYQPPKPSKIDKPIKTEQKKDVVAISDTAKDFQSVIKALSKTPDIRTEKVDTLKEKIDSGKYNVSDEQVADKMVRGFFA